MTQPLLFVVAVALVDERNRLLLSQRPEGKELAGFWEFPGGKVEEGESPEEALRREMEEELDLRVRTDDLIPLTFSSHAYPRFRLFMPLYLCRAWQGEPRPMEGQKIAWITAEKLEGLAFPPADISLISFLKRSLWAHESKNLID